MRDGPTYKLIDALLKEGHPLMIVAARQIASMRAERADLGRRISNQRKANRDNWEIVEQRRKWLGSDTARRHTIRYLLEVKRLRALLELRKD